MWRRVKRCVAQRRSHSALASRVSSASSTRIIRLSSLLESRWDGWWIWWCCEGGWWEGGWWEGGWWEGGGVVKVVEGWCCEGGRCCEGGWWEGGGVVRVVGL